MEAGAISQEPEEKPKTLRNEKVFHILDTMKMLERLRRAISNGYALRRVREMERRFAEMEEEIAAYRAHFTSSTKTLSAHMGNLARAEAKRAEAALQEASAARSEQLTPPLDRKADIRRRAAQLEMRHVASNAGSP